MCFWRKKERLNIKTAKDLAEHCKKPYEAWCWARRNIKYVSDPDVWKVKDYWQTPEETLELRTGDCEDVAILLCKTLDILGVKNVFMAIWDFDGGHAVCFYELEDGWHKIGVGHALYIGKIKHINELPGKVLSQWKFADIYDLTELDEYGHRTKLTRRLWRGVEL